MSEEPSRWPVIAARAFTIAFGLFAVGWACFAAPLIWRQTLMTQLARKLIAGEQFAPGLLANLADATQLTLRQDICQPTTRRALAVIRLRLAEEAINGGDSGAIKKTQSDLESALAQAFACVPSDPFLWLAVFWLKNNEQGLGPENFKALRFSYQFGPNEGWLSIRRNRYALAVYSALPEDLQKRAIEEFVQLVRSDFISDATEIAAGPGRPIIDLLLAHLVGIDDRKLRFLAKLLDGKGIDARIPGVETTARFPSG